MIKENELAIKLKTSVDDEYGTRKGSDKDYYNIAHTLIESIAEQPNMISFGTLKAYQVHICTAVINWVQRYIFFRCALNRIALILFL